MFENLLLCDIGNEIKANLKTLFENTLGLRVMIFYHFYFFPFIMGLICIILLNKSLKIWNVVYLHSKVP